MIEYIKGRVAELTPTYVVVETQGGVAYLLNITLTMYERLQGERDVTVRVHEVLREDSWTLFGFVDAAERELFRQLIGVSGVGANSARMILSAIPSSELPDVIATGNLARLKSVKGIGAKTAQRIIVDLKDKIKGTGAVTTAQMAPQQSEVMDEALAALVMLGFARPQSQKVLEKIFASTPAIKVEAAIKQALAMM